MGTCTCTCMSEKPVKADPQAEIITDQKKISEQLDKSIQSDSLILTAVPIPKQFTELPEPEPLKEVVFNPDPVPPVTLVQSLIRGYQVRSQFNRFQSIQPQPIPEVPKTISTMEARQAYSRLPPFKFDRLSGDEPVDWKGPTRFLDGSVYVGEWNNKGLQHGKGIMYYIDGGICEGYWKDGKLHGGGRRISPNGDVYSGNWINGKMHGQGVMEYAGKSTYTGTWMDNKQHGIGAEVWLDGSKFEGNYVEGRKCGKGKFFWADGTKYEGEFLNDVIEGIGKYTWSNREYEGMWKNSKMHGKGIFRWKDGKVYEGDYIDDIKEGYGVLRWPDGKKYEGQWKNGKYHGNGTLTQRGKSRTGLWEEGEFKRKSK